jgi:hypothetical protein
MVFVIIVNGWDADPDRKISEWLWQKISGSASFNINTGNWNF